jgi:hypothetical protein
MLWRRTSADVSSVLLPQSKTAPEEERKEEDDSSFVSNGALIDMRISSDEKEVSSSAQAMVVGRGGEISVT